MLRKALSEAPCDESGHFTFLKGGVVNGLMWILISSET